MGITVVLPVNFHMGGRMGPLKVTGLLHRIQEFYEAVVELRMVEIQVNMRVKNSHTDVL